MGNDLVAPDALSGLPGAPFTDSEVDLAVATLRGALGWHVAPQRTETVVRDINWPARWVTLPTKALVSVAEVRRLDDGDVIAADRYRVSKAVNSIRQCGIWPVGHATLEIDMTHGYTECPPELLPVLAEIAAGSRGATAGPARSVNNGIYSVQFGDTAGGSDDPFSTAAIVARFSIFDEVVIA